MAAVAHKLRDVSALEHNSIDRKIWHRNIKSHQGYYNSRITVRYNDGYSAMATSTRELGTGCEIKFWELNRIPQ